MHQIIRGPGFLVRGAGGLRMKLNIKSQADAVKIARKDKLI